MAVASPPGTKAVIRFIRAIHGWNIAWQEEF
jgi:hypothetical protein